MAIITLASFLNGKLAAAGNWADSQTGTGTIGTSGGNVKSGLVVSGDGNKLEFNSVAYTPTSDITLAGFNTNTSGANMSGSFTLVIPANYTLNTLHFTFQIT